jgi:hypothetical protein
MSSVEKGFSGGFGAFLGVVVGAVVLYLAVSIGGRFVAPCPACHGSGNCALCGGDGKGMLFGDCLNCGGKKSCPKCGGVGWRPK